MCETKARVLYKSYAKRRSSDSPAAILGDIFTDHTFRSASLDLAHRFSSNGHSVYLYRFDWQSPAGFEACHCLDIPFVFNNLSSWAGSPMLQGVNEDSFMALSQKIQGAWAAFSSVGDPNHNDMPDWKAFTPESKQMMKFDLVLESATVDL
jgi:para-nitrobenzyl esterase